MRLCFWTRRRLAASWSSSDASAKPSGGRLVRKRMQIAHHRAHPLVEHMSVNLRRRDIGVAEQFLHNAQIGAVLQQMAGEGMAQSMRMDVARGYSRRDRRRLKIAREGLTGQMAAVAVRGKQKGRGR